MRSADAMPPVALRRWLAARDAVLRGLVHTLSNRLGTVVAASGILTAGSADVAGKVLEGEAERLETLLAEFRLATEDPFGEEAGAEPLILREIVAQAVALRAHIGDAREATVVLGDVQNAPPVLASRAALLHALVVLLAGVDGNAVALRVRTDDAEVELSTEPPAHADAVLAAAWLVGVTGGRGIVLPRFGRPGNAR